MCLFLPSLTLSLSPCILTYFRPLPFPQSSPVLLFYLSFPPDHIITSLTTVYISVSPDDTGHVPVPVVLSHHNQPVLYILHPPLRTITASLISCMWEIFFHYFSKVYCQQQAFTLPLHYATATLVYIAHSIPALLSSISQNCCASNI